MKAHKIAYETVRRWSFTDKENPDFNRLIEQIADALRAYANEALERAAKVATSYLRDDGLTDNTPFFHIAAAIRALAREE